MYIFSSMHKIRTTTSTGTVNSMVEWTLVVNWNNRHFDLVLNFVYAHFLSFCIANQILYSINKVDGTCFFLILLWQFECMNTPLPLLSIFRISFTQRLTLRKIRLNTPKFHFRYAAHFNFISHLKETSYILTIKNVPFNS